MWRCWAAAGQSGASVGRCHDDPLISLVRSPAPARHWPAAVGRRGDSNISLNGHKLEKSFLIIQVIWQTQQIFYKYPHNTIEAHSRRLLARIGELVSLFISYPITEKRVLIPKWQKWWFRRVSSRSLRSASGCDYHSGVGSRIGEIIYETVYRIC